MVMSDKTAIFQLNPQHRVTSIATALGSPNYQMEITPMPLERILEKYVVCGDKEKLEDHD